MSTPPNRGHRGAAARAALVTVLGIVASALLLAPATPAAADEPVEDMGCRMVIWTSDSGLRHLLRPLRDATHVPRLHGQAGLVDHGLPCAQEPAAATQQPLSSSECRVGDYHLSGVKRTTYKGIRVVVFKYRFDYLVPC